MTQLHLEVPEFYSSLAAESATPMAVAQGAPWLVKSVESDVEQMVGMLREQADAERVIHWGWWEHYFVDLKLSQAWNDNGTMQPGAPSNVIKTELLTGVVNGYFNGQRAYDRMKPYADVCRKLSLLGVPLHLLDMEFIPNADPVSEGPFPGIWADIKLVLGTRSDVEAYRRVQKAGCQTMKAVLGAHGFNADALCCEGVSSGTTVYGALGIGPVCGRPHIDAANPLIPDAVIESAIRASGVPGRCVMHLGTKSPVAINTRRLNLAKKLGVGDVIIFPDGNSKLEQAQTLHDLTPALEHFVS